MGPTNLSVVCQKLERLLEEEKIEKPFIRKQIKFRFPERGRSGRTVLTIKNLQFGYGDEVSKHQFCTLIFRGIIFLIDMKRKQLHGDEIHGKYPSI